MLPIISVNDAVATEGEYLVYTVTLSESSQSPVTVDWRVVYDGEAGPGDHYYSTTGTLRINAGETTGTIRIRTFDDTIDETDETFTLELSNPDFAQLSGGEETLRASGTILDNDGTNDDRALSVSDPVITEGDDGRSFAVFQIRLSEPFDSRQTFSYTTADGTARAGEDYLAKSGNVVFEPGQTEASVRVEVLGDETVETAEGFSLVVGTDTSIASGVGDAAGEATILNDDGGRGLPVINLSADAVDEGGYLYYTVTLSEPSQSQVTLDWRLIYDGEAGPGDHYYSTTGTLRINAGDTVGRIAVRTYNDTFDETDENMTLEVSNPTYAVLSGGEATLRATGAILDNDGTSFDRALFVSDPSVTEGDNGTTWAVFELRLSEPYDTDQRFDYVTRDGTATAGEDYKATAGSVEFKAGQMVASVRVEVIGDTARELAESFSLVVGEETGLANGIGDAVGEAAILNDDAARALPIVNAVADAVDEGGYLYYTVTLTEPSLSPVTMDYRLVMDGSAGNEDHYYSGSGTLRIDAGETAGRIGIRTYNDTVDESDENLTLELSNVANAVFSGREETMRVSGMILDNDGSSFDRTMAVSDPVIEEGDNGTDWAVFEIRLSEPFETAQSFAYTTRNATALAGEDYVAKSGRVTFEAGQSVASVRVAVKGDTEVEGGERFSLAVTPSGGIAGGADTIGRATIQNDDAPIRSLQGNNRANTLTGTAEREIIRGFGGDDRLSGGGANDTVIGAAGDDFITGGDGEDVLNGGAGNDAIFAGAGDTGDDTMFGGAGNDIMGGGEGADSLIGGNGRDTMFGGRGNDILRDEGADGRGTFAFGGGQQDLVVGNDGGADTIGGGTGNDTVRGLGGRDALYGGKGPQGGDDRLEGGAGADRVFGGAGEDTVAGGGGNDLLFNGAGRDVVRGDGGADTLYGGGGNDVMTGGGGADVFAFVGGNGRDRIVDFTAGTDKIDLSGDGLDISSFAALRAAASASGGDLIVEAGGGTTIVLEDIALADLSAGDFIF